MSTGSLPAEIAARPRGRRDGAARPGPRPRRLTAAARRVLALPEMLVLAGIAGLLNLWGLSINGWANDYYSAAVRSMASSWHNFLFASMDPSGLMTVDKPPLALWVQALSARIFGFHPLSILIPQALMGMAATALMYDLVRRRFGRIAGTAAGFALATTPIIVAVSRHNNPDELLVLCSVAALWCALRAFEAGKTRWLVLCGIAVGLGFETKMLVAMFVVPGIALAWMWVRPHGRTWFGALKSLLAGGIAMIAVAGAWPLLVTLTPAADRPWISGTADNSIWSLIFGYNGVGRVAGQAGGPGGGGGFGGGGGGGGNSLFGGATGPFRLLQSGLGDQAGWLLGFAIVAGLALLVITRLRRRDPRTAWLIVVGGAFLTTAVVFSYASGIFHPYYVSLLAPFAAALIGAGVGEMLRDRTTARIVAPRAIGAGVVTELVVLGGINGSLSWAKPLVIAVAVAGVGAVLLALRLVPRMRLAVLALALAALFAAPVTWAAETIGHATSGTFPTGGPASAEIGGPGGGGPGGGGPGGARSGGGAGGGFPGGARGFRGGAGTGAGPSGGFTPPGASAGGQSTTGLPPQVSSLFGNGGSSSTTRGGFAGGGSGAGGGGMFGGDSTSLNAAIAYAKSHGGGTIGVSSQSTAASVILSQDANVAGLGGFSGRESTVSATWIAQMVKEGRLRWVLADQTGGGGGLPGDTRTGSEAAMNVVAKTCKAVTFTSNGTKVTMYHCAGRASAILAAAKS